MPLPELPPCTVKEPPSTPVKLRFAISRHSIPVDAGSVAVIVLVPVDKTETVLELTVNGVKLIIDRPWNSS
jgi:hypothetical protein